VVVKGMGDRRAAGWIAAVLVAWHTGVRPARAATGATVATLFVRRRTGVWTARLAAGAILAAFLLAWLAASSATAAECGGAVVCKCGDTVTSDYAMTANLGPCPRLASGDTIGLAVRSGVTLNCQDHAISGPADTLKDSFGIRVAVGTASGQETVVDRCVVTGFWWGAYVSAASDVRIQDSIFHQNGWKDPTLNGTGYGIDISASIRVMVSGCRISDNGNEGVHVSYSSRREGDLEPGVTLDSNTIFNNGREQIYLFHSDGNIIHNNQMWGGTQGLEMRFSSNNQFSYNTWSGPLHWLENDDQNNTFLYDSFDGRVVVGDNSLGNEFRLVEFTNATGACLHFGPLDGGYIYKSRFDSCLTDLEGSSAVTLERSVANLKTVSKAVKVKFPGCIADVNLDGAVDDGDRPALMAAMNSSIGDPRFNPEVDLDHDGQIDAADLTLFNSLVGPCAANLTVIALNNVPATRSPGTSFLISDTVKNLSPVAAGSSRTQFYLSSDAVRNAGDKLLGGHVVPALVGNQTSTATISLLIPSSTALGAYFLLACADDTGLVDETNETDNCLASTAMLQIGRPDLVVTALTGVPSAAIPGSFFPLTDTVKNQSAFPAGVSRTQFFLSADGAKDSGDRVMSGARVVPALESGLSSTGTVTVTVPSNTPLGAYYVLACADGIGAVPETDESNNCLRSTAPIQVGRPDLAVTALGEPPATAVRGSSLKVSDTVTNQSPFQAGTSRVQYYLSLDTAKNVGDRLLTGFRIVPALVGGAVSASPVTQTVTIPAATPPGAYYLVACADDTLSVIESDETNNCRASVNKITVTQ